MQRSSRQCALPEGRGWLVRRIVWAVMLGLHAAWLVRLLSSGDASVLRLVTMGLSVAFLLAKTLDVAALRFLTTRRAVVAGILIVAILHVGVIDRALGDQELGFWVLPLLTSVAVLMTLLHVIRRRVALALARRSAHLSVLPMAGRCERWISLAIGGPQFLPQPVRVLRGPPSNNL